jgi:RND family efflux transporter MFP subunit
LESEKYTVKLLSYLIFATLCLSAPVAAEELQATLHWGKRVELSLPQSGLITEVKAEAGDEVKTGQVLLSLDARPLQAEVKAAQGELDRAKADKWESDEDAKRAQELHNQNLTSNHELAVAKNAALRANAEVLRAEGELAKAKLAVEYAQIKAPFAGLILARQAEPGQTVVSRFQAAALLTLVDHRNLAAVAAITPAQLEKLKSGQELEVVAQGQRYRGQAQIVPAADGGYSLTVRFTPTSPLSAGQAASIILP